MKKITNLVIFGSLLSINIFAEYGCMDTSYHTAQLCDPKEYYLVTGADGGPCSCPCSKYCAQYRCSLARGKCPVCQHYRVPRPLIIVRKNNSTQELTPAHANKCYSFPIVHKYKTKVAKESSH